MYEVKLEVYRGMELWVVRRGQEIVGMYSSLDLAVESQDSMGDKV